MFGISNRTGAVGEQGQTRFRKTLQAIMPYQVKDRTRITEGYDIYPSRSLGNGKIFNGYETLAKWIATQPVVAIEGFSGVLWEDVQTCLAEAFKKAGVQVQWIPTAEFLKPAAAINELVTPFLGERDSVWGTKATLKLEDYFEVKDLATVKADKGYDCTIVIGVGASLTGINAPVVYLDVPKNEIQYRMRAGVITNLGMPEADEPAHMYKHYYFIDWVVLNEYKARISNRIVVQGDVQWKSNINWMFSKDLQQALQGLSENVFRVRPWFEPGAWGGHWMQERIEGLNKDDINYAWSFELIVPENGLVLESDGYLLEVPFDLLMLSNNNNILGKHAPIFGMEFPIRFDFLDTWEGGNLSIQCHPALSYIRQNFGENITQDETYYILDCKEDATVYLGFQEDIDPAAFREVLENSKQNSEAVDVEKYVQCHHAKKHDLYLIPNGTVHSAGKNNMVLEISATPYIFTFKMYDWLRLDLNGEPRAINIEHAFNNLRFERKGKVVQETLISHPAPIEQGKDWELIHLPTHEQHFYDVHRIEFDSQYKVPTNNVCHVLMLVEGESVTVQTAHGQTTTFQYAETFVIPAAAKGYTLVNNGSGRAKVIKAFVKDDVKL